MTTPIVKFVASPAVDAAVRLDLTNKIEHDDFALGRPTFDGSPESIGVEYGYRDGMSLTARVTGTEATAMATLQTISREALRSSNWLLYQQTLSSTPVWFRTYRTEPGDLSLDFVKNDPKRPNHWRITVPLVADSFAYGARETQAMQQINNDPAAGSLNCFAQLPAIKGDAPTPARIRLRYTNAQSGYRHMLATSPVPASYTAPITWPIGGTDGWTVDLDTGASASDAAMAGSNYRPVPFGTTTALVNRLHGPAPTSVPPGRYKILLRAARSDTSSKFTFRLGIAVGFGYIYGDTVAAQWTASTATKHTCWVDLGDFNIPGGLPLEFTDEIALTPDVALQVGRTSGTGAAWLDHFLLVPVGDEFSRVLFVDYQSTGPAAVLADEYHDAEIERTYIRDPGNSDKLVSMPTPILSGGFHILVPGANNVVHFVEQTALDRGAISTGDVPDRLGTDAQMIVSYYPRYLNLRGD